MGNTGTTDGQKLIARQLMRRYGISDAKRQHGHDLRVLLSNEHVRVLARWAGKESYKAR